MPYDRITQAAIDYAADNNPTNFARLRAAIEAKHPAAIRRAKERVAKARFERKFSGNPPGWVKTYVTKYGRGKVSQLNWHRSRVGTMHGQCETWDGSISVTVPEPLGEKEPTARAVVLHEIAHAIAPYGSGHGDPFYDEWARLLKAEGLYRHAVQHWGRRIAGSLRGATRRTRK